MTPPIERVRYYDGEYLRAFDFDAEQGYHVDMRRRLNMALHLYGIVEGLQLSSVTNVGITQVSVSPGMAIDPYGREILLLAPYAFDDTADVQANRITLDGNYQVWIQYVRVADTPPSVGYAACNGAGQTTRWRESSRIILLQSTSASNPPAVTDDISEEDPDTDTSNGVYLGTVTVARGSVTGVFGLLSPQPAQPPFVYVGLRAQQIQPPNYPDTVSPAFDVTKDANSLVPPIGVDVPSNLFVDQNLIVGDNFIVDQTTIQPQPAPVSPAVFPNPTGNVKVEYDLFLQGELYTKRQVNTPPTWAWLSLGAYVKTLLPDVQVGAQLVPVNGTATNPATGTVLVNLSSSVLTHIDPARIQVMASISQLQIDTTFNTNQLQTLILGVTGSATSPGDNTCVLTLTWTAGPCLSLGGSNQTPWGTIKISYVVILYPL